MTLKAKIKFKTRHPNGISQHDQKDDVIVIKVKRKHWEGFSRLLGAARDNSDSFGIVHSEVQAIEQEFDNIIIANT